MPNRCFLPFSSSPPRLIPFRAWSKTSFSIRGQRSFTNRECQSPRPPRGDIFFFVFSLIPPIPSHSRYLSLSLFRYFALLSSSLHSFTRLAILLSPPFFRYRCLSIDNRAGPLRVSGQIFPADVIVPRLEKSAATPFALWWNRRIPSLLFPSFVPSRSTKLGNS